MIDVYGLKSCDSCKKALRELKGAKGAVAFHDIREEGVSKAQIEAWAKAVGWENLLNKASTTWRGLEDGAKADLDRKRALALMAEHPTLMKRPIISRDGVEVFVGWSADIRDKLGV